MTNEKPVYCMHCEGWYAPTKIDQCNIGEQERKELSPNIAGFIAIATQNVYGKPSELNTKNDCPHYREINSVGKLFRKFFYDIPLRPTVESKVK